MKKILLIDDNDHLSAFLENNLRSAGYDVVSCVNGVAAIQMLADYTPDFIFCDFFLPNLNGDKLCRIIRKMGHLKDSHLVIMSAAASELSLDPATIGADAFIAKGSFLETERHILSFLNDVNNRRPQETKPEIIGIDAVLPRQITKELLDKNSHLQALLESLLEGLIELYCGRIVYANTAAARILGKTQDQLLAVPLPELFEGETRSRVDSLIAGGPDGISGIDRIATKHSADSLLSVKRLPFHGDPDTVILLINDITEKVRTEKALLDYRNNLEDLVRERTADLKQANEMLQKAQKLEAIGTLAGGIAHEFNNILGAMIGYMELAQLETHPDELKYYVDQALHASQRAKDVVSQVLVFSRKKENKRKPVVAAAVVRDAVKLIKSFLPSTIRIAQDMADQSSLIMADSTQIEQVLMNLCTNAAHAMREKGGTLEIRLSREKSGPSGLRLPDLPDCDYVRLTVGDTGHGIAPDTIDRIFDPFFTTKGPREGTGLGLSVVYGIVRDHGGAIDVASEPGKGTVFNVLLPVIESAERTREAAAESIPGGHEHILFIDDEEFILDVETARLTSLGYRVTTRKSSEEALELFRARPEEFDLVITDMTMPNIRGDNLAREMLKIRSDIPVILCTGYSDMISEEQAKSLGIRQFVMKPIYKKDLARVIRKALD